MRASDAKDEFNANVYRMAAWKRSTNIFTEKPLTGNYEDDTY